MALSVVCSAASWRARSSPVPFICRSRVSRVLCCEVKARATSTPMLALTTTSAAVTKASPMRRLRCENATDSARFLKNIVEPSTIP
jgi:hypothetical protein